MLIYMSSPIPLGMKSTSELCLIDTNESLNDFKTLFNLKSPKGIKCIEAYETTKKINVVSDVECAEYVISGLNKFNELDILNAESFIVADKKKGEKEARDKIISLKWQGDDLICVFKFGNENLRPDVFIEKVVSLYGGNNVTVVKTDVIFKNNKKLKEFLELVNV